MTRFTQIITVMTLILLMLGTEHIFAQSNPEDGSQGEGKPNQARVKLEKKQQGFIDVDGDGYNDYAPDQDNDGIPNGQDEDYIKQNDGSGRQLKIGKSLNHKNMKKGAGAGNCDDAVKNNYKNQTSKSK